MLVTALTVLTGCETAKYTFDQTFKEQQLAQSIKAKQDEENSPDIVLANVDDWIKEHLW